MWASRCSDGSDEENDNDREGGEEKKVDDAVSGMVPVDGEEENNSNIPILMNTDGEVGFANEDEVQIINDDGTKAVSERTSEKSERAVRTSGKREGVERPYCRLSRSFALLS